MAASAAAMLRCSKSAATLEQRKQYDRTHKRMVRLIREWNQIEQTREVAHAQDEEAE